MLPATTLVPQIHLERVTFDTYEVNFKTEELWRGPRKVRCQRQPFRVLRALVERAGEVVSRDELQAAVWGPESPSDADHSLGIAVNKLREALGDSAESPRFIETLSRRGYRFIAPLTSVETEAPLAELSPPEEQTTLGSGLLIEPAIEDGRGLYGASIHTPRAPGVTRVWGLAAAAATVLLLVGLLAGWLLGRSTPAPPPLRIDQVTHTDSILPWIPSLESFPVLASDGSRLYSSVLDNGQTEIDSIDPSIGEMQRVHLPAEIVNPTLSDIAPDGSRLLVRSQPSSESEQPVWIVPRSGGSGLRLGNVRAHDAVWTPDGQSVLYAVGNDLDLIHVADGTTTHFAGLPGRAFYMRWSPDGKLLRFTLLNPLTHTTSLWQISHGSPHPLLAGWTTPAAECCGVWTADGRNYVFQSSHESGSDLWRLRGQSTATPEKLTNGPLLFASPMSSRVGDKITFVGLDVRSELQRFDPALQRFVGERGFLTGATRVTYSRDGRWAAWTDITGHLWRARAEDGSEKLQLTPDNIAVFLASWMPDGTSLLAMGREPGHSFRIYRVRADGGAPEPLLRENRNQADPSASPDGRYVVFGRTPDLLGHESGIKQIQILDLLTHAVTAVPGSEGLFSPRWSPDGKWIAALTLGDQKLMLFDVAAKQWKALGDIRAADPVWTADNAALFVHEAFSTPQRIERIAVPSGAATMVAVLNSPLTQDSADSVFVGITRSDAPLVRVRTSTANLYSLTLNR